MLRTIIIYFNEQVTVAIMHYIFIRKVPGSNLTQDTDCHSCNVLLWHLNSPENCRINTSVRPELHSSNSFPVYHSPVVLQSTIQNNTHSIIIPVPCYGCAFCTSVAGHSSQHNITHHGMLPQYPTSTTKLIYDWF